MVASHSSAECKRLFINGLPRYADNQVLSNHFAQFGEITDCYIPADLYTKEQKVSTGAQCALAVARPPGRPLLLPSSWSAAEPPLLLVEPAAPAA